MGSEISNGRMKRTRDEKIQAEQPDIESQYGMGRSWRRGSDAQELNKNVPEHEINRNNTLFWKSVQKRDRAWIFSSTRST